MNFSAEANIVPLLQHLSSGIQPYLSRSCIQFRFISTEEAIVIKHEPVQLVSVLMQLILDIAGFLDEGSQIELSLKKTGNGCLLTVKNDGRDLSRIKEITDHCRLSFTVSSLQNGTEYSFTMNGSIEESTDQANPMNQQTSAYRNFYALIRKRLRSHFTKSENLVALLNEHHPIEAAFLKRVNQLIRENLDDDRFDAQALARAMNMSRTQLFRKLKPLIRQAPANYIKTIRLQRAKELLETTDMTISEVTNQTGFNSQSHLTKVFTRHYGLCPSLFRRNRKEQTDKTLQQTD